jgi:hypothetical protein
MRTCGEETEDNSLLMSQTSLKASKSKIRKRRKEKGERKERR